MTSSTAHGGRRPNALVNSVSTPILTVSLPTQTFAGYGHVDSPLRDLTTCPQPTGINSRIINLVSTQNDEGPIYQAMIEYNNAIQNSHKFVELTELSIKALDRTFEFFEVESSYEVSTMVEEIFSVESFDHHHA